MTNEPTKAQRAIAARQGLRRGRRMAIAVGMGALAWGPIMWAITGTVGWMLVSAFGALWLVGMLVAMRAALKIADEAVAKETGANAD